MGICLVDDSIKLTIGIRRIRLSVKLVGSARHRKNHNLYDGYRSATAHRKLEVTAGRYTYKHSKEVRNVQ